MIDADAVAAMSRDDHRRGFTAAMAVLLAEFNSYLDRDHADPVADRVSYRQSTLWLSRDERDEMINEIRGAILPRAGNPPSPDREPHLLSTIMFPIDQLPPRD